MYSSSCAQDEEAVLLSFSDRVLGWHLGLGDLGNTDEICHGYQHACVCSRCRERENPTPVAAPQPWETAA